jgi:hypothetical protein
VGLPADNERDATPDGTGSAGYRKNAVLLLFAVAFLAGQEHEKAPKASSADSLCVSFLIVPIRCAAGSTQFPQFGTFL